MIFEEQVSNYMSTLIKVEDEDMQQSGSTLKAVKNETDLIPKVSNNNNSLSNVGDTDVEGDKSVPHAEPQTKTKHYECEHCGKVFPAPSALLRHIGVHTVDCMTCRTTCVYTYRNSQVQNRTTCAPARARARAWCVCVCVCVRV